MSGRVGGDRGRGRRGGRGGGRGEPFQPRAPAPAPAPSYGRGRGRDSTQSTRGRGGAPYAPQPQPQPYVPQRQPQPRTPQPQPQPQPQPHAPQPQPQPYAPQPQPRAPHPGEPSSLIQRLAISTPQQVPHPSPPPRSSKSDGFPPRPGFGRAGKKCIVRANHFLVDLAHNCDICHYDVAISPETSSRSLNRSIIAELVKLHKSSYLGGRTLVYDGRKSMYTAGQLPFPSKEFVIKLEQTDRISNREREFRVTIKFAAETNLHHLHQFLEMRQLDSPQATIQALDVVLRESPCTKYTTVGRSFFSTQFSYGENANLGGGVEYWRGFYQSLRPTQMGLSLNIDIAATSFYKGASLVNFVMEYLNLRDTTRPLSNHDKIKLKKVLKGVRVETTHNPKLPIRYKITGISSVPVENMTFAVEDNGASLSVVQYFREKYGFNLKFIKWPCLLAGNDSRPKYIPMEVCLIIPGQRYVKKLSENQVRSMLKATCKRPREREDNILQVVNENNYSNDKYAKEFGLKIYNKMVSIEARVLPPPMLKYHESGEEKSCQPIVGQWNMMRMKMVNGGSVTNWACLNFSQKSRRDAVINFCDALVEMCNHKGMVFNTRPCIEPIAANPKNLEVALRDLHKRVSCQVPSGQLDLLIIILPDVSGSYGMIKKVCETELGIVSQCCLPRHVAGCNGQYLENISLKINVKVGGRNNVLEDALSKSKGIPYLTDRPTIIFGADVTHPAPGEDSSPSIAAVVASMDWPEVTKYRGVVSAQTHREEIIKNLYSVVEDPVKGKCHSGMIRELLIAFNKSTNRKPERIIFYRDGVSEGQFSDVLLDEMDQIRRACASLQEGYLPPVTFVVVQKRHHTRLFPEVHGDRRSTDRSGNILPGTVVDTKICHPTEFDFYLCSHAGIQGTSRPTHYHVLYDENNFTADGLQTLTNNLCYTYARCTRSVSIVPPAYYAHLAAFRARYYMEAEQTDTSSSLGDRSRENPVSLEMLPEIKKNVKDVMFYC